MARRLMLVALSAAALGFALALLLLLVGDRVLSKQTRGVRLLYALDPSSIGEQRDVSSNTAEALKRRLDPDDIRGIAFNAAGPDRIEVLAPDSVPIDDLKRMLGEGGVLSFHVVAVDAPVTAVADMLARLREGGVGPEPQPGDTLRWLPRRSNQPLGAGPESVYRGTNYILVHATPERSLTREDPARRWALRSASRIPVNDRMAIAFELDDDGAKYFGDLTEANIGLPLAIVLDGSVISAPNVNTRIAGHGIIEGGVAGFSDAEVSYLVAMLNASTLPASLLPEPLSEQPATMTVHPARSFKLMVAVVACVLGIATLVIAVLVRLTARPLGRKPGMPPPLR